MTNTTQIPAPKPYWKIIGVVLVLVIIGAYLLNQHLQRNAELQLAQLAIEQLAIEQTKAQKTQTADVVQASTESADQA